MGTTWARPESEVEDGDEDGDAEDPAPTGAQSLASDSTKYRMGFWEKLKNFQETPVQRGLNLSCEEHQKTKTYSNRE